MLNGTEKRGTFATRISLIFLFIVALLIFSPGAVFAHGVHDRDQEFLTSAAGIHLAPFAYLGAKHMVTGYDHLAYLAGVLFFLSRLSDIVKFVSLFAIGHSITLLFGVLAGVKVSPYAIDAVIGFSVCYKALENLGLLRGVVPFAPDPRLAVFLFGLVHGFGLSSKLQDLNLSPDGLIPNMLAFNIGVEIGQFAALSIMFVFIQLLRSSRRFSEIATWTNLLLFGAGIMFAAVQIAGLILER